MQEKQETWVWSLGQDDPLEEKWQPPPAFLSGEFHGWRSLKGYSPWGCKELDTTGATEHSTNYAARNMGVHVPFQIMVSPDTCPGVGLLGYMVALFLVLEGISILLSIMAAPVYIPANSAREFSFLHALSVTERWGVQLLTAQKPINRPGWWKGKCALFQMPATKGEGRHLSKGWLPPTGNQGERALTDRKRGYMPKQHNHLWQWSSNLSLVVWPVSSWLF